MKKKMKQIIIILIMIKIFWSFFFDVSSQVMNPIKFLSFGGIDCGDMDGDGRLDVMVGGMSQSATANLLLYRQNRSLFFVDITNGVTFPGGAPVGFNAGRVLLADLNRDGSLDFFYTGYYLPSFGISE